MRRRRRRRERPTATSGGDGGEGGTIALLLPESQTARYETQDRPLFEAKVEELCPDCEVLYSNADQDAAKQLSQAEAALTNGAEVLVLDPVDGEAAGAIVAQAAAQDVPVISYDRLILDAEVDLYISFDNEKVGELQATALVDKLEEDGVTSGDLVMINGSPTDNNATLFKQGAHSVSTRAASPWPPSRTPSSGSRPTPRPTWTATSPPSALTTSSASTPPTTAPPVAPSPP